MKRNRTHKKMLNKSGPKIQPCGKGKPYTCSFAITNSSGRQSKALGKSFKSTP